MELIFLGTSCMVPTKDRNHQSIFLSYKEEGLLFDCGEGTQRQLKTADVRPTKISRIFISHWHGDNVLGLPGLLQTMNASNYERKLEIYGPKGIKEHMDAIFKAFVFTLNFEFSITEISDNTTFDLKDLIIEAKELTHGIPCVGYSIIEKDRRRIKVPVIKKLGIPEGPLLGDLQDGKDIEWKGKLVLSKDTTYLVKGRKVAIILDTIICNSAYALAKDSDVLVCEAVYSTDLLNKAEEYKHMTAAQAASLASQSNAKKLVLTHFSQRYKTTEIVMEEATPIFRDVIAAYDLMKLKV